MTDLSIASRIFKRELQHSEADRQRFINKRAAQIMQGIVSNLLTSDVEAMSVADEMLGMETEQMAAILRCALRGDYANLRTEVLKAGMNAVQTAAEYRAIKEVEAMTPEDFLPD